MKNKDPTAFIISFNEVSDSSVEIVRSSDYSPNEILERSTLNAKATNRLRRASTVTSISCEASYNQLLASGQSWGSSQDGWPLLSETVPPGVMMLGRSTRPGGDYASTHSLPLGDAKLRPAVPVCQGLDGNPLSAEQQASLAPRDTALGEDPVLVAGAYARWLWMRSPEYDIRLENNLFLVTNVTVGGRTAEEWAKGAPAEVFNRLRVMTTEALETLKKKRRAFASWLCSTCTASRMLER